MRYRAEIVFVFVPHIFYPYRSPRQYDQRTKIMSFSLNSLNEEQLKPVMQTEGAVLVTAGAGSGKTRLLTHRIAHIIEDLGVPPYNVLAITFTNKAANEMRERLNGMMDEDAADIWVFTFHALCVRILRKFIKNLGGYTSSFSIYGEQEKEHCVKRILKGMQLEEDMTKLVIASISDAKNMGMGPDEYAKVCSWRENIDVIAKAYFEYEKELRKSNSLDYDDLLNKALYLLKTNDEARDYYQNKFRYIHVDEFQDTNKVQYDIVKILAAKHGNVFVVGDEDQSIYGWRGANFANIFDFQKDFPNVKTYKLEQNYRSTKNILALANKIIANNTERLDKKLWTENADGADVKYYAARSDGDEADFVVQTIHNLKKTYNYKLSDFAILMRINALSRTFEERFMLYGVPHKIYGGFKFYERKEVKDILAYLKIIGNHNDNEAIARVINFPKRGIGDGTVQQLLNYANVNGTTLYDVIFGLDKNEDLPAGVIKKVLPFTNVLQCIDNAYNAYKSGGTLFDLTCYIIRAGGFREFYAENTEENEARKNNIRELAHGIEQFEQANPSAGLDEYLQQISLYSDLDEMDEAGDCVNIATIHSAKGLEFKVVFVVGLEDGIFPDSRKAESKGEMEEERRLMYVAVTRAKERLYLTRAKSRFRFGERKDAMPSEFLRESGFEDEKPKESAYSHYSGRYDSYRGERSYSSYGDSYNREEVPVYSSQPKEKKTVTTKITAPEKKPQKDLSKFGAGCKVRHKKFGEGTVVSLDASGEPYVEVEFNGIGKLKLLLAYAPLEPIES